MQIMVELSTALMKHCEADGTPFYPVVGEPCCARFSGQIHVSIHDFIQCV